MHNFLDIFCVFIVKAKHLFQLSFQLTLEITQAMIIFKIKLFN